MLISFVSYKGGVGKTTLLANLAFLLHKRGRRSGMVDLDFVAPGLSTMFQISGKAAGLNTLLTRGGTFQNAVVELSGCRGNCKGTDQKGGVYLLPAGLREDAIFSILKKGYSIKDLRGSLLRFKEEYSLDFLLLDTHPGFEEDTLAALMLSDLVLIILRPDLQSIEGSRLLAEAVGKLRLPLRLIINMYNDQLLWSRLDDAHVERGRGYGGPSFNALGPLLGVVPYVQELQEAMGAEVFALTRPGHPFTRALEAITDRLIG